MNQTNKWFSGTAGLTACMLALAMSFAGGCKRDEPVRATKTPAPVIEEVDDDRPGTRPRRQRPTIIGEEIPPPSSETVQAAPTRHPAFVQGYKHEPIVIRAVDMMADNGVADAEGGWLLNKNGALTTAPIKVDFMTARIDLEMKGAPAGNIWPEVDLNMYNRTLKKNYFPFRRTYVTTSTYHLYEVPVKPQLTPGEYHITFRFYNNQIPAGVTEDRNVYLKSITLHPYVVTEPI